jgi:hypothetical protein
MGQVKDRIVFHVKFDRLIEVSALVSESANSSDRLKLCHGLSLAVLVTSVRMW